MSSSGPPSQPPSCRPVSDDSLHRDHTVLSVNETLAYGMSKHLLSQAARQQQSSLNRYARPERGRKRISSFKQLTRWARSMIAPGLLIYSETHIPEKTGFRKGYYRQMHWMASELDGRVHLQLEVLTIPARTHQLHVHILVRLSQHAQMRLYHRLGTIDHQTVLAELGNLISHLHGLLTLYQHSPMQRDWMITTPRGVFVLARDVHQPGLLVIKTWISNHRLYEGSPLQRAVRQAQAEGEGLIINHPPFYPILSQARLQANLPTRLPLYQLFNQILQNQYPPQAPMPEAMKFRASLNAAETGTETPLAPCEPRKLLAPRIAAPLPAGHPPRKILTSGRPDLGLDADFLSKYARLAQLRPSDISRRATPAIYEHSSLRPPR